MNATEKAKAIRLAIFDVDGILTSGHIYYGTQGEKFRAFHVHDGLGLKLLMKAGINVGIISAKKSAEVQLRLDELGIHHIYLGQAEKIPAYEKLLKELALTDEQVAYMGDDLPDLALLKRANFAATVPSAAEIIKKSADYISKKKGGKGAVREVSEYILKAQNQYETVIQSYL